MIEKEPNTLFIFNDNTSRYGNGGNAIIRGHPQAFGLATGTKIPEYEGFQNLTSLSIDKRDNVKRTVKEIIDNDIKEIKKSLIENLDSKGNKRKESYNVIRYSCDKKGFLSFKKFKPSEVKVI